MQLDSRLKAVAGFVEEGSRVADIGTDHAYLAIYLIRSKRARFVIASDKNNGPYESAKRTVKSDGISDKEIQVRIGDGLSTVVPGEVDTVCIAGMGGVLISEILESSPEVLAGVYILVLQPMNAAKELRIWLYEHHWYIADECLAVADGRIYEIIQAKRGERTVPPDVLLSIGPVLWEKKPDMLKHHIERLLFQAKRVATGMEKSRQAQESDRYSDIQREIHELEEHLKW